MHTRADAAGRAAGERGAVFLIGTLQSARRWEMSLINRLELVRLCNEIETLVKGEDFDYGYNQGGVRVHVMSGKKAEAEGGFIEAAKTYLNARRTAKGEDLAKAKEAFLLAFEEYAKKMGYA
jgi:hypothetical protein